MLHDGVVVGFFFPGNLFLTFYFEISLGLQKSCENYTENSRIPFIHVSLMVASAITVESSKPKN